MLCAPIKKSISNHKTCMRHNKHGGALNTVLSVLAGIRGRPRTRLVPTCVCGQAPSLLTCSSRNQPCKPSLASLQRLGELLGHTILVCRYLTNYYPSRHPSCESSHTPPILHVAVWEMSARILRSNEPDALELWSVSTFGDYRKVPYIDCLS